MPKIYSLCFAELPLGPEGPEGVAVATSRGPEGEGREDWVLPVSAAEGFMNNAG